MASRQEWYTEDDDADLVIDSPLDMLCQKFTLGTVGNNFGFNADIVKLQMKKTGNPTGDLYIYVLGTYPNGSPNVNDIFSSLQTPVVSLTSDLKWRYYDLISLKPLIKGGIYCIYVFIPGTSAGNSVEWRCDASGPTYAGGEVWVSTNGGDTWTKDLTKDAMFQIEGGEFTGTLCSYTESIQKAGANASAISTDEILVSDFVKQAEGIINAVTRFNWIDAYPTLTDDVKHILNQVASDLAAIYIISYDMSGFTDRVEAETMINVYRESVARGLSLLKNQEVKDFMVGDT